MPLKPKKILKLFVGALVFLTLPSLLLFGFLYFKYNEALPTGIQGEKADKLALKMLDALDYQAYKNTNHLEWTFKKRHHYSWDKANNICEVSWKSYKVILDLNNANNSKVFIHNFKNESELAPELIDKAITFFNNDSFWLIGPYKVFDKGVERRLVKTKNNKDALLVTYTSGGSTPGDSYLWLLNDNGKPYACKIWTSILPIDGLEASWNHWMTTDSGAQLPQFHKLMVLGLEITDVEGTK